MRKAIGLLVAVMLLASVTRSQELLTRQINLLDMVNRAGTIVRGEVVGVRVEPHPGFPNVSTLKVTLRVTDSIYGAAGRELTFRSYVGGGKFANRAAKPDARTDYRVGDELLLFLHPNSSYGLTSPVGQEQGRFHVVREGGRTLVLNSLRNRGLFEGVDAAAQAKGARLTAEQRTAIKQAAGPVELRLFSDLVRQLAAVKEAR